MADRGVRGQRPGHAGGAAGTRFTETCVACGHAAVLRFSAMHTLSNSIAGAALAALLSATAGAPAAHAQTSTAADSGVLVVFDQLTPVAHEKFVWQNMGDSIVVTASARRTLQDDTGERHVFEKNMVVVVDARDYGLMRYLSDQKFQGKAVVRGVLPGDTVLTYFTEDDRGGSGIRLVQPPGRLFVIDTPMFTLFDVLCRSLAGKEFQTRRVQLLTMTPDTLLMPAATITRGKLDTLTVGTRKVTAQRYTLEDPSIRFELWTDARSRLLRLSHRASGMSVERAPDAPKTVKPRPRARAPSKR